MDLATRKIMYSSGLSVETSGSGPVLILIEQLISRRLILDFLIELTGTSHQLCLLGCSIVFDTILLQSPLLVFAHPIVLTVDKLAASFRGFGGQSAIPFRI